jgi:hypothetical protein
VTENTAKKQRGTPFQKGRSGNPSGKPRGTRNRTTVLAEKLMQDDAKNIVRAVLDAAKAGDMTAARLILDRISPVRRGRPVYLELPSVKTAADISAAMATLITAMASGDVTPDEAATAASVLELRRKALETEDLNSVCRRSKKRDGIDEDAHQGTPCSPRSPVGQQPRQPG